MKKRYFGQVIAEIDNNKRKITLTFAPRYKQPLDDKHPQRCLSWALAALQELTDKGYVITVPEAVPSG